MKSKKKNRLVLVDGQNAAWAAYHAYSRLSYKGKGVGIIYGLPSMIAGFKKQFPGELIIVWEGRKSPVRKRILPEYKEHRKSKSLIDYEDFLNQKNLATKALYYLGVPQAQVSALEGDDLLFKIWKLSHIMKGLEEIVIVSADKDFHQLIGVDKDTGTKTVVWNNHRKEKITKYNCKEIYGYHPYQTVDYLTLVGDKSDNIPGYRGIGEKKATELLEKYDSLANFIESGDKHPIIKRKLLLELIKKNKVLIDLNHYYHYFVKGVPMYRLSFYASEREPQINIPRFNKLAAQFNMRKLMGNSFIQNFKQ